MSSSGGEVPGGVGGVAANAAGVMAAVGPYQGGPTREDGHHGRTLVVTNVQRFSLHDGGGIRSVAFVKGCPFRCPWCCNPENLSFEPQVAWHARLCIGCSARADGRRDANGAPCETAPEECPTGAKERLGRACDVAGLADELLRDRVFFEESAGGVTVSGGECLAGAGRQEAVLELLERCHAAGVGTAVETTLAVPLHVDAGRLARTCDAFLVDFKIADRARSLAETGIDPDLRDANLRVLLAAGAHVVARLPVIPGHTDGTENARANARRAVELGVRRADVLPFHQLGQGKYESLGMPYAMAGVPQLADADVAPVVAACEEAGLEVVVRGA